MDQELFLFVLAQVFAAVSSIVGVPVIQWLKGVFGLKSDAARLGLAGVLSAVLGLAAVALGGELAGLEFSLESILSAMPVAFASAHAVFKLFVEQRD